jgi:hypothetical protein
MATLGGRVCGRYGNPRLRKYDQRINLTAPAPADASRRWGQHPRPGGLCHGGRFDGTGLLGAEARASAARHAERSARNAAFSVSRSSGKVSEI